MFSIPLKTPGEQPTDKASIPAIDQQVGGEYPVKKKIRKRKHKHPNFRGLKGGDNTNRLRKTDTRRYTMVTPALKLEVGRYALEKVSVDARGKWKGIEHVKKHFRDKYPGLQRGPILRYRETVAWSAEQVLRSSKSASKGRNGAGARLGRDGRRGLRLHGAGRESEFSKTNLMVWAWYVEQLHAGLQVSETRFFLEYSTKLRGQLIESDSSTPLAVREAWLKRLELLQEDGKAAANIRRKVCRALRIFGYKVQLLSDLSDADRADRITKTWQGMDHAIYTVAAAASGDKDAMDRLAAYWGPEPLVSYWKHVVIVMFDHVPQWMKRLDEKVMLEVDHKLHTRKTGSGGVTVGNRGGGAAEKWRITSIMSQAIFGWFDSDREPVGVVLPTISITYGTECCLEDIPLAPEAGSTKIAFAHGPNKGKPVHASLMKQWRQLRSDNQLRFLGEKMRVWQQPNAWCSGELTPRLLNSHEEACKEFNGGIYGGMITQADLFVGTWCDATKAFAKQQRTEGAIGITIGCRRCLRVCNWAPRT